MHKYDVLSRLALLKDTTMSRDELRAHLHAVRRALPASAAG